MSSLGGGPLFRVREETLSADPEEILCVEPEKRPSVPILRVCLAWEILRAREEALFYEPERRSSLLGPGGGSLC